MEKCLIAMHPDGKIDITKLDRVPQLDQLKEIVGGWIEIVPYFTKYDGKSCIAFCNEEGKLHGLPYNPNAQKFWEVAYGRSITEDYLVGPIAIVVGPHSFLKNL
jgi:hypothetical protein